MDAREFEWESQLRFYWVNESDELRIRQCTGEFGYGYEYMGLNGRLVITPLTDRIYLTITQVNRREFEKEKDNDTLDNHFRLYPCNWVVHQVRKNSK